VLTARRRRGCWRHLRSRQPRQRGHRRRRNIANLIQRLQCTCTLHRPIRPSKHASSSRFPRTPNDAALHLSGMSTKTLPSLLAATRPRRARDRKVMPQRKGKLTHFHPCARLSAPRFQSFFFILKNSLSGDELLTTGYQLLPAHYSPPNSLFHSNFPCAR